MTGRARFTIVSAVYDVAPYLPDFIASIEGQDFDLGRVQVVMVDDGSPDNAADILRAWAQRRPELVTVISQANAGQGAARNAGLARATGEWVTFPDPDDVLDENYLSTVDAFLTAHPTTQLVATNRLIWDEATGELNNTHPLHRFFAYDRLTDLDESRSSFHGSAPAAFFRTDLLREHALEFDGRIRPNFEDGHFTARYLLRCEHPVVGFLKSTRYRYRKRADASSALATSMLDPRRYTDVFEHGYLPIVADAQALHGSVPDWLQHFLVYELYRYLTAYEWGGRPMIAPGPETEAFHRSMAEVLGQLDLDRVVPRLEFTAQPHLLAALVHGYRDETWHQDQVFVDTFDSSQRLARVRYLYRGEPPVEEVVNGEQVTGPRHAKTRPVEIFGRTLLQERVLWVRIRPDLRIRLNGEWATLSFRPEARDVTRALPIRVRQNTGIPSRLDRRRVQRLDPTPTTEAGKKAKKAAAGPRAQKKYADAWVLLDRIHDAGDSGEVLFRRLRQHHPEINAWFTIEKGTPDWHRLRREFGNRVVAHGSADWLVLMAHCTNLLSSHADLPITSPPAVLEFTEPTWRFTFLQHGVIKDDLTTWLRIKQIDLFVTSTVAEHASIAGDGTAYPFTTKEVRLTGLPRFDRLLEVADRFPPAQRDLVLVTPTWRSWLVGGLEDGQRRSVRDEVLDSDFVRSWVELLRDPDLAEACRTAGVTLALLPHPNLRELAPLLDLPDHVQLLDYVGTDVQEYFARARVLVTDYSSIAFNAAYLERPVVYFQFDADRLEVGAHVGRPGYFSYEADGFGPVLATSSDTVGAVRDALRGTTDPTYAERARTAFGERDGGCSERVIAAVQALARLDDGPGAEPTP